jgi:heme-degrading monooxygenase HmoA
MYARLTFIEIDPKDSKEVSSMYNTEIVPAIREFKGVKDVMLLEPTDSTGQFISITTWKSKADADEYENSGTYRRLVDKFKEKFISKPVLKTYNAQESNVPVM